MRLLTEAALLGLASGPACLASCGPVLTPWLVAERAGWRRAFGLLSVFLGGRLAGYLLFAVAAGLAGATMPLGARERALLFAAAHLGLAATLVAYGLRPRRRAEPPLVTIGPARRSWMPVLLGLFTGLNLCPPFVVAAVRAMETGSVTGAVLFFLAFFAGTAVWFVPFAALGALRVAETVATVARFTMLALAAYYAYLGILTLLGRLLHG
ncbi:MAG: sulfite exporter TauE/SafE family protein [Bryobacterales bacterium]|nr:sulfite exporter TauE/SafE family protein [Bryobacterales bacterium]